MEKERSAEVVLYQPDERTKLEVQLDADTVWLTQAQICELFQKVKSTVSYHISNIFKEGELDERVVVRKSRTTTIHGASLKDLGKRLFAFDLMGLPKELIMSQVQ